MPLTPDQAAQSLNDLTEVERRSSQAYRYSRGAPYFLIWGLVWMLGYGAEALAPALANWTWLGLILCGVGSSVFVSHAGNAQGRYASWRFTALFGVIALFTIALFAVMPPANPLQMGAYWPLLFGAIYAAAGLWMGLRYIAIGAFLTAATLGAYFLFRDYFLLWMALAGGGSLFLTGLWLKRV